MHAQETRSRQFLILAHSLNPISIRQSISNQSDSPFRLRSSIIHRLFQKKKERKKKRQRKKVYFFDLYIRTKARKALFFSQYPFPSAAISWKTYEGGGGGGGKKREKLFIHRLSTLLRVFQSPLEFRILVPVCTYSRIYARVTRMPVSVARAAPVANIKEGGRAGVPRENTGRGEGGGIYIYIHIYTYIPCSEIRNTLDDSLSSAGKQPHSRNSLPG